MIHHWDFLTHSYCNQVYKKDKLFLPSKYYEGYLKLG